MGFGVISKKCENSRFTHENEEEYSFEYLDSAAISEGGIGLIKSNGSGFSRGDFVEVNIDL